jgi:hypothetical protein
MPLPNPDTTALDTIVMPLVDALMAYIINIAAGWSKAARKHLLSRLHQAIGEWIEKES